METDNILQKWMIQLSLWEVTVQVFKWTGPPHRQRITPNHGPMNSLLWIPVRRKKYFPGRAPSKWSSRKTITQLFTKNDSWDFDNKSVGVIPTNGTFNIFSCPVTHKVVTFNFVLIISYEILCKLSIFRMETIHVNLQYLV